MSYDEHQTETPKKAHKLPRKRAARAIRSDITNGKMWAHHFRTEVELGFTPSYYRFLSPASRRAFRQEAAGIRKAFVKRIKDHQRDMEQARCNDLNKIMSQHQIETKDPGPFRGIQTVGCTCGLWEWTYARGTVGDPDALAVAHAQHYTHYLASPQELAEAAANTRRAIRVFREALRPVA